MVYFTCVVKIPGVTGNNQYIMTIVITVTGDGKIEWDILGKVAFTKSMSNSQEWGLLYRK